MSGAPQIGPSLGPESQAIFAEVTALLGAAGIPFRLDPRLVRGLDYYAHTTFELWHESLQGAQNALGGGGRYDGLAEVLGFPATPGSGYALGVERTLAVCREQGLGPAARREQVVVLGVGPATDTPAAAAVARRLRVAGIAAAARRLGSPPRPPAGRAPPAQGARAVVLVGEAEAAGGSATWKDLDTRPSGDRTGRAGWAGALRRLLAGG